MTTKNSANAASARKKLITRIAATQRLAATAKKTAKLAKFGFRHAKRKFKDARRAARKLRKAVKTLKTELAALAVRKPRRKRAASKSAPKRVRSWPAPAPAAPPLIADTPLLDDIPPVVPAQ
ncbi:MAG TPA: hypothetical protein VKC51_08185 [Lacunisphaera sp.]|nr:hypothetical protein [Lacunisphaera sp.]